MSECPSFWCSRCRKSHPDECPPAPAEKKAYPPGFVVERRVPAIGSRWSFAQLDPYTGTNQILVRGPYTVEKVNLQTGIVVWEVHGSRGASKLDDFFYHSSAKRFVPYQDP